MKWAVCRTHSGLHGVVITGTNHLWQHPSHHGRVEARAGLWLTEFTEVRSSVWVSDVMRERVLRFSDNKRHSLVLAGLQTALNGLAVTPSAPGKSQMFWCNVLIESVLLRSNRECVPPSVSHNILSYHKQKLYTQLKNPSSLGNLFISWTIKRHLRLI